MSFYIKIDNSRVHNSVAAVPVMGSPVEGPAKICLVTAFTSVVGNPKAAYAPDRKNANKDLGWVSVSLADQEPVTLPFAADEFEDLVLDAERKNRIADFRHEHWPERLDDLIAIRRANDTSSKATHEIGAIESTGEHKGEIYGGIYPADNKPIWFSAAPRLMDHYKAAVWAEGQGGSLPTRKQGDYLTTLKGKGGAFTEILNRGKSFPAGYVWLAEPNTNYGRDYAWCQRLSDGNQDVGNGLRNLKLPVLSVVR